MQRIICTIREVRQYPCKLTVVALAALRKKKNFEQEVDKIEDQKRTVDTQLYSIQNANIQYETLQAMKKGAAAMKSIHKNMNIDKVDKTIDEIRDQMDISHEISEALSSQRLGVVQEDEDDLAAELERMQQEDLETKLLDGGRVPAAQLPAAKVPATKAPAVEEDEDEEADFARLQAEFAM